MKQTSEMKRTFRPNTRTAQVGFRTRYITCMKCEDRGCEYCVCPDCKGSGKEYDNGLILTCWECQGSGRRVK